MNTEEMRSALMTAAADLTLRSRGQYTTIRQEMTVAAGCLRSIAAGLTGRSPEEAEAFIRSQRELLDRQDELFAWSELGRVVHGLTMAQLDAKVTELRRWSDERGSAFDQRLQRL